MPNRIIRDAVLDSSRYHAVDKPARLAFLELLLCCDDYGLVPLADVFLRRHCTAFEGLGQAAHAAVLSALADQDLIRVYENDGARFAYIPRFGNNPRAAKPKWPAPPAKLTGIEINDLAAKVRSKRIASAVHVPTNAPETETETETVIPPSPSVIAPQGAGAAKPVHEAEGKDPKTPKTRGTRLPADWVLPKAWGLWALAEYPHWTPDIVRQVGASFSDHWHAATGRGSTKADWPATWRNWCRSDIQQRKFPKAGKQQTAFAAERTAQADRIMGSYAAEVRAADNPQPSFIDMEAFDATRLTDG